MQQIEARDIFNYLSDKNHGPCTNLYKIKTVTGVLREVLQNDVRGDVYEFGVYKGSTSLPLLITTHELASKKNCHLFDTFEGMPEPNLEFDFKIEKDGKPLPVGALTNSKEEFMSFLNKGMSDLVGEGACYTIYKGDVRSTVKKGRLDRVCFAVFDVDYYDSTKHLFNEVPPLVQPNGVIYVDDYFSWEGARKATEEFIKDNKEFTPFIIDRYYFLRREA